MRKINYFINNVLSERLDQLDKLSYLISQHAQMRLENRIWPIIRNRRLLVLTDDPHFATQARFTQKTLCHYLNKELSLKLNGVDIKLIAIPLASFGRKSGRTPMSEQTIETLASIAQQIQDEGLRQALVQLALAHRTNTYNANHLQTASA
ncbi:hypothetical protein [uncultured Thiothrix sp.]|uniref:hypothetical protein n=1 Tax=uncultured Thiothrix sp. TaxID=223185 RepID=UPI00261A3EE3|nr:hypothetical protein [uncultured Thiothrix sp.]